MTTYKPSKILRELKTLISYSCSQNSQFETIKESMHVALIKKYFCANKVSFDYKNNLINVQIPMNQKEFTNVTLECQDMEKFLTSCIEKDATSLSFYQNMLTYYNVERNVA